MNRQRNAPRQRNDQPALSNAADNHKDLHNQRKCIILRNRLCSLIGIRQTPSSSHADNRIRMSRTAAIRTVFGHHRTRRNRSLRNNSGSCTASCTDCSGILDRTAAVGTVFHCFRSFQSFHPRQKPTNSIGNYI